MRTVALWKTVFFVLYEFGITASFAFVNAVLIPNQIITIVGEQKKALALGIILGVSSIINLFAGPLTGWISDSYMKGKRLPFVLIGTILWSASVFIRGFLGISVDDPLFLWLLLIFYFIITTLGKFFYTVAQTPYVAMIPDLYDKKQIGQASGMLSGFQLLGACIGVAAFGFVYHLLDQVWLCLIAALLPMLSMISLFIFYKQDGSSYLKNIAAGESIAINQDLPAQDDEPLMSDELQHDQNMNHLASNNAQPMQPIVVQDTSRAKRIKETCCNMWNALISPLRNRNFLLVFLATFVCFLGTSGIQTFFLYYLRDMIHPHYTIIVWDGLVHNPEQAQGAFLIVNFATATTVAALLGCISDRLGAKRRFLALFGAISTIIAATLMITWPTFNSFLLSGIFWGIGAGSIMLTTVSLVNENLPDNSSSAKDLAVWNVARNVPQILASAIAGTIVFVGGKVPIRGFGYDLLYGGAAVCQLIGALFLVFVRPAPAAPVPLK